MITTKDGFYLVKVPYNLKDDFKAAVPAKYRGWDDATKSWKIAPEGIQRAHEFLCFHLGHVELPALEISNAITATVQKTFTIEYIGQCKERGAGTISALGSVRGFWCVEFPEAVLKAWFEKRAAGDDTQTYYQILCVFESATGTDIKSAHRRLARQWHPDVCGEPEAAEKFRELTDAYEILRDPQKRKRYDAGLFFEREAKKAPEAVTSLYTMMTGRKSKFENKYFRAPLRCGLITAEGIQALNKFTVSAILSWDDITDGAGRVMTTSWNKHAGPIDPYTGNPKGEIEIRWI